ENLKASAFQQIGFSILNRYFITVKLLNRYFQFGLALFHSTPSPSNLP
ncbi:hypothetical protein Nmel_012254, partial [Mimus melanotis]